MVVAFFRLKKTETSRDDLIKYEYLTCFLETQTVNNGIELHTLPTSAGKWDYSRINK